MYVVKTEREIWYSNSLIHNRVYVQYSVLNNMPSWQHEYGLLQLLPFEMSQYMAKGWRQEFSDGGLTLPKRGLKYGFYGTINAKNLRKNRFSPSDGELACSDEGAIAPSPPLAPPFIWRWSVEKQLSLVLATKT